MHNWLIIENGIILAKILKETNIESTDFVGTFDTVAEDPSGLFSVGDAYTVELWEFYNTTDAEKFEKAKTIKGQEILTTYQNNVKSLVGDVNQFELASWGKQEAEARAYLVDNTTTTPILSTLILNRGFGETVAQLAEKIVLKADLYAVNYASILGIYHAKQKALEMATTVNEVLAVI